MFIMRTINSCRVAIWKILLFFNGFPFGMPRIKYRQKEEKKQNREPELYFTLVVNVAISLTKDRDIYKSTALIAQELCQE